VTALQPIIALGAPGPDATVQQPFLVAGWAIDQAAAQGPGVDAVHVYAYPADASGAITGAPRFLGVAAMGGSRPDVGAIYGEQFTNSGFGLWASELPSGFYRLVVYARSTVTVTWSDAQRVAGHGHRLGELDVEPVQPRIIGREGACYLHRAVFERPEVNH